MREKLYADFREDFDGGLKAVLESVAGISNAHTGRVDDPQYHSDWAFTWTVDTEDRAAFFIVVVEQAQGQPYAVLANVTIIADEASSLDYIEKVDKRRRDEAHGRIIQLVVDELNAMETLAIRLEDQFKQMFEYHLSDEAGEYLAVISVQRLGMDAGHDVIYRVEDHLRQILEHMNDVAAEGKTSG
ncbi:hypothetical protein [Amycolatopsis sp. NPDC051102]|uniref:hypothetical protein n=1 Tax=Amycolatopsis sp. NPDC051102 TaxID=3155163 RepID=UPI00342F4CEB